MKNDLSRQILMIMAMAAASLLAACGSNVKTADAPGAVAHGVRLETVNLQQTPQTYEAVGTVRSATVSVLGAQIGGTVRQITVRPGDRVRRGQVLALIDDRPQSAQVGAAEAGVEEATQGLAEVEQALDAASAQRQFAEITFKRYQGLLAKNSVSRQEFDSAETRYKAALANERALEAKKKQIQARGQQANSQLASAQTALSYSRIVSPLDGIVSAKSVDAGTVVMPGTPILTVEDAAHYRLEASLPAKYAGQVRRGEQVGVETGGGKFTGQVAEVVPAADPASRTVVVKVELPAGCGCQSGDYGTASFPVGEEKILAVPPSALVEQGQLTGVFVVNADGTAEYRLVKTGRALGNQVEILSGLSDGERVAVSELDQLKQGVRVENP
jgi:membrane fusion protein, multidrug efflux system